MDMINTGRREPSLDEILAEPITRLVMRRDGVTEAELRRLCASRIEAPPKSLSR